MDSAKKKVIIQDITVDRGKLKGKRNCAKMMMKPDGKFLLSINKNRYKHIFF